MSAPEPDEGARWISVHLHYHEDLDRAVRGFVHPLAEALATERWINGLFFLRHGLGGPHLRLRLRPEDGAGAQVREAVDRHARGFLDRSPSRCPVDPESIRRSNAVILASDPGEADDAVHPDNSYRLVPFRPEVARYGGPERFRLSLDVFTLSSVAALEQLLRFGHSPRSTRLTQAFGLLLRQAAGFAVDLVELSDLLRYGVDWLGEDLPKVVEKAGAVARTQGDLFRHLLTSGLEAARAARSGGGEGTPGDLLVAGAAELSAAVRDASRRERLRIGASQLHLTASRLGIAHAEEVYLSRLLTLTLAGVSGAGELDLSWLGGEAGDGDPAARLRGLLPPALSALATLSETARAEA